MSNRERNSDHWSQETAHKRGMSRSPVREMDREIERNRRGGEHSHVPRDRYVTLDEYPSDPIDAEAPREVRWSRGRIEREISPPFGSHRGQEGARGRGRGDVEGTWRDASPYPSSLRHPGPSGHHDNHREEEYHGHSASYNPDRGMRTKAREFHGTGSWREYKSHFDRVCRINKWTHHKLDYLWVNLAGTALAYAESLPERRTRSYTDLTEALEERFGDERLADVYKAELRTRQRREGESIPALGQEIRRLVQYAYPGVGIEGIEELAIERFREALSDPDQRMSVHQSHPRNLDEAIQVAMDLEAWQISEKRRSFHDKGPRVRAVKEGGDDRLDKVLEKMEAMMSKWTSKPTSPPYGQKRDYKDYKCYSCGRPGHISRNCPDKQDNHRSGKGDQGNDNQSC